MLDAPDPAQQEAEWQVALKQATQAAQMMGQLPAGIALAVEKTMKPRIDWRAILRRFVQQSASRGLFLANAEPQVHRRGPVSPGDSLGVDARDRRCRWIRPPRRTTSCRHFKAELQSIVEECQPESTIVIMADAKVQRVDRFERGEAIEFNVEGFGGTDFRPAFEHVDREELCPACLIYLTDGDGVYPDEPSAYPTLWAITTPNRHAPWGETVNIDVTGS